jgi:hypothetical protein
MNVRELNDNELQICMLRLILLGRMRKKGYLGLKRKIRKTLGSYWKANRRLCWRHKCEDNIKNLFSRN